MGSLTLTKCEKCGGTYPHPDNPGPRYFHVCPPPRDADPPPAIPKEPVQPAPARWRRVRAMLTHILDWIEGRL
jgi:hypothetical protein